MRGIFEEGNYSQGGNGEFAELRAYILAKLLWNPDGDVDAIMSEFLDGYYGKASKPMREYIELIHEVVRIKNIHVSIYSPPTSEYLSKDIVNKADGLLEEAEGLADDGGVKMRVKIARLPIQYVMIERDYVDEEVRGGMIASFFKMIEKVGITNISEGMTTEQYKFKGTKSL